MTKKENVVYSETAVESVKYDITAQLKNGGYCDFSENKATSKFISDCIPGSFLNYQVRLLRSKKDVFLHSYRKTWVTIGCCINI